jgi:branched-chain amino acid transport system substrate-binding protein
MMPTSQNRGLTRREFLKHAGAGATSWLVLPNLPGALPLVHFLAPGLRLSVVLPPFDAFPQVGNSFMDGMALFFSTKTTQRFQPVVRQIPVRSSLSAAVLEPILNEQQPDVVISMLDPEVSPELATLLRAAGTPLFVAHAGANRLQQRDEHIFYNTLGYWQASYRAGMWAAEQLGQRVVVVSSFYESGYDALYAFQEGFGEGGGRVLETLVTHVPGRELSMADLCRRIGGHKPDVVYGHLSGRPAVDFATAYSSSAHTRSRPLLGSGFLTEKALQIELHAAGRNLRSVFSWSPQLDNVQNSAFLQAFTTSYGTTPDSFAVLGYEIAALLATALTEAGGRGPALVRALRQARFEGPRGLLQFDAETQSVTPPLYLRQVAWLDGAYEDRVLAAVEPVAERLAEQQALRSGFLNPYLSI